MVYGWPLRFHQTVIHDGEKNYACHLCPQKCSTPHGLKVHIRSVHEKIKFPCDICGKLFMSKSHIARHVASVHENHKNVKCHLCNHLCNRYDFLKLHVAKLHGLNIPIKELRALNEDKNVKMEESI